MDMYKFSDQVITSATRRCVCCAARGFTDCPASVPTNSKAVRFTTPAAQKIKGQRLDLSDCEGTSTAPLGGASRKRALCAEDSTSSTKKSNSGASCNILTYFKSTIVSVAQKYADLSNNPNVNVFGQCRNTPQKRKYIF